MGGWGGEVEWDYMSAELKSSTRDLQPALFFFSPTNLQSAGWIESMYLDVFFDVFSAALLPDFI